MTDSTKRKTLTLKPRPAKANDSADKPRSRSGARARKVAQRQMGESAPTGNPPSAGATARSSKPARAAERLPDEARGAPTRRPASRKSGHEPRQSAGGHTRERGPAQRSKSRPATPAQPQAKIVASTDTHYAAFAPCPAGLETVLAAELTRLGMEQVEAIRAGCHFRTTWDGMMRANLHSRIATRILLRVAQAPVRTENDLLELARSTPWERWFGAEQRLRVDTSAVRSPFASLQYCTLRTKDGICDRLRELEGARPDIDTVRPDARVHVFLNADSATLYLDTSGESLFKRGWRFDKGVAPLRENLAAGMLALVDWQPHQALIDPFCGSGTILIEAAQQALGIAPGSRRPFSFERLRGHDTARWHELKAEARAAEREELSAPLIGSDNDPEALRTAQANLARAGLPDHLITWELRDARDLRPTEEKGWILSNPPYGDRMAWQSAANEASEDEPAATDAAELWQAFSSTLKAHFDGWQVGIITTDLQLPRHLRLTPRQRIPLYNGALECRLFLFDLVGGSYRQKL